MALSGWANGNYIQHGSAAALDDMLVGTQAFWIFPTDDTARQVLMAKGPDPGTNPMEVGWNASAVGDPFSFFHGRATTILQVQSDAANFANYGINKWLFLAVTWDSVTTSNNKILIGDLTNIAAEPSSYSTQQAGSGAFNSDAAHPWRIGRHSAANGRQFVGRIASYWVFNKVLSAGELANLQWQGRIADWASCLIYTEYGWAGATATQPDWTGKGNNGTVTGTLTVGDHVPKRPPFSFGRGWQGNFTAAAAAAGQPASKRFGGIPGMAFNQGVW